MLKEDFKFLPHPRVSDPLEATLAHALDAANIPYLTDYEKKSPKNLDFYLPDTNVHIEVKGGDTPRALKQLSRDPNVILVKGVAATRFLAQLINPDKK